MDKLLKVLQILIKSKQKSLPQDKDRDCLTIKKNSLLKMMALVVFIVPIYGIDRVSFPFFL